MKKIFLCLLLCLALLPMSAFAADTDPDALFPARFDDKWGYINSKGETVIEPQWIYANAFRGDYATVNAADVIDPDVTTYKDGIIDRTGKYVVEPKYTMDEGYDGSFYGGKDTGIVWVWSEDNTMGFFDIPSGFFSGTVYDGDLMHYWVGDGRLIPACKDGLFGYVDRTTGEVVISYRYEYEPDAFEGGLGCVPMDDDGEYFVLVNEKGEPYSIPDGLSLEDRTPSDGLLCVMDETTGDCGFADTAGNVVIKPQFDDIKNFSEGYAAAQVNGLWGHIDKTGSWVCEPKYDALDGYEFHNGLAVMYMGEGDGSIVIDETGAEVFRLEGYYLSAFEPSGVAIITGTAEGETELFGFVDRTGKIVLPLDAGYVFDMSYADDYMGGFKEGLQVLVKDGKYGFIDLEGKEAIPVTWGYADDGNMGYIDHTGTLVWQEP